MSDQIKQIAERLRGLRDVLELTSPYSIFIDNNSLSQVGAENA